MTPKEKAEELVYKFCTFPQLDWTDSKQCALIAVDELVKQEQVLLGYKNANGYSSEYWEEVIKEIKNL